MTSTEPAEARLDFSVGIFAYNEAGNIIRLLDALQAQRLDKVELAEIIVVSSASTDGTDELVEDYRQSHPKVSLIRQAKREGKSSAINLFLEAAQYPLAVVISGDVVPDKDCMEELLCVFEDPTVGASGGRPVPENSPETLVGFAVHLLWRLHHRMALKVPKLGEMIAFRKLMQQIPAESAVDEASIEAIIREAGYRLVYRPDAIIRNRGPENWRDFIKQRRRIQNGHLWLKHQQSYSVASQDSCLLLKVLWEELRDVPFSLPWVKIVLMVEAYSRLLGTIDYYWRKKNPFAWDIAQSSKHKVN